MAKSEAPLHQVGATQIPQDKVGGRRVFADEVVAEGGLTQWVAQTAPVVVLAAAGTNQATASAITLVPITKVTGGDGTKGVVLPQPTGALASTMRVVSVSGALKVYPPVGGTINGGSVNANITLSQNIPAEFTCLDGLTWFSRFS